MRAIYRRSNSSNFHQTRTRTGAPITENLLRCSLIPRSDRRLAPLARADAHHVLQRQNEDLPITDLSGPSRARDRLDHCARQLIRHRNLQLGLREKIHRVFVAPVDLRVAFLPPEAFDFGHRHAFHAGCRERVFDLFESEGLDDRNNEFHGSSSDVAGIIDIPVLPVVGQIETFLLRLI